MSVALTPQHQPDGPGGTGGRGGAAVAHETAAGNGQTLHLSFGFWPPGNGFSSRAAQQRQRHRQHQQHQQQRWCRQQQHQRAAAAGSGQRSFPYAYSSSADGSKNILWIDLLPVFFCLTISSAEDSKNIVWSDFASSLVFVCFYPLTMFALLLSPSYV